MSQKVKTPEKLTKADVKTKLEQFADDLLEGQEKDFIFELLKTKSSDDKATLLLKLDILEQVSELVKKLKESENEKKIRKDERAKMKKAEARKSPTKSPSKKGSSEKMEIPEDEDSSTKVDTKQPKKRARKNTPNGDDT